MEKLSMSVVAAGRIALPSPDGVALSGCGNGGLCCVCLHASTLVCLYSVRIQI